MHIKISTDQEQYQINRVCARTKRTIHTSLQVLESVFSLETVFVVVVVVVVCDLLLLAV